MQLPWKLVPHLGAFISSDLRIAVYELPVCTPDISYVVVSRALFIPAFLSLIPTFRKTQLSYMVLD